MGNTTSARPNQLLLAVVQAADADAAIEAMTALGTAVTQIHTSGGLLRQGNVTLLSGVEASNLMQIMAALRRVCYHRLEYVAVPLEGGNMPFAFPMEVEVGGATVFAFPVERYEEL